MAEDAEMKEIDAGPFEEESRLNDLCIQVEGKKLFVSKAILSTMSPEFKRLCFDANSAEEARVELKNHKYEEILTMLKCMVPHPSVEPATDENLEILLKLGKIYSVRFLQDNCSAFMKLRVNEMEYTDTTSFNYLKMAVKYNVEKLFDGVIDLLIRKASNLEKEFLTGNDADLPPEITSQLYRNSYLKFKDTLCLSEEKESCECDDSIHFSDTCLFCSGPTACFECDSKNLHSLSTCVKCGSMQRCMC